jgi:hypothetical protein
MACGMVFGNGGGRMPEVEDQSIIVTGDPR